MRELYLETKRVGIKVKIITHVECGEDLEERKIQYRFNRKIIKPVKYLL